ncbi:putative short chain type dehydrogenase [Xylaria scruposa]|nr:putative short chain type dehydrogenase [Xylaria scruposa]
MPSEKIVLIIGAGPNLGSGIASKFRDGGYKVALAARSLTPGLSSEGTLGIKIDLADPTSVPQMFETVKQTWGIPNIVVYNGAKRLVTPPEDPFSASLETIKASRAVGFDSAYIAAQEALTGFKLLPKSTPKAFIFTGNTLNQIAIPGVSPFAYGKVAAAMMIEYAANAYGGSGFRFYYADERFKDGLPVAEDRDGEAHGNMYWELAHEEEQSKWQVTFTKEGGRREFIGKDFDGYTREDHFLNMKKKIGL